MTETLASAEGAPVLVVDQFEELFTLADSDTALAFCRRLTGYASDREPVVVCVRADHLAGLSIDAGFARLAEQGLHLVSPLTGDELRAAIEQTRRPGRAPLGGRVGRPVGARHRRRTRRSALAVPRVGRDVAASRWPRRSPSTGTGPQAGSVARWPARPTGCMTAFPPNSGPCCVASCCGWSPRRWMVTRCVAGSPPPRWSATVEREQVVALLVRARLVTAEAETVELAHEALARAWPRLQSWLDEDAAGQRILRHLAGAADRLGQPRPA